jgi:type II secretory pathway component GspD/PulD (secretin)
VPISTGVSAAIFNTREATTTLTVQDGHTIIIGGLITTNDEDTVSKVPVAGDIPGLGLLFRKAKKTKERRELLIILTPRVVTGVESGDALTAEEKKSLKLMRGTQRDSARDPTKDTIYVPLEEMTPGPRSSTTKPSVKNILPDFNASTTRPLVAPRRTPEKEYE